MEENNNPEEIVNEKEKEEIEEKQDIIVEKNLIEKDEEISFPENSEGLEESTGIKISNEAVATYAGIAVSEVKGVYGKGGTFSGLTEALSGKKNIAKGIKVDVDEKNVKIDVNIIVIYGARIPDVAFDIQSRVKKTVENMTGLNVLEVNVNVLGVHPIDKDENITDNFEDDM